MDIKHFKKVFIAWIPLSFAVVALGGLVYLSVQQDLRQAANDPQIQMAEDTAAALSANAGTVVVPPSPTVNIGASLSPYLVIFDDTGTPLSGNGMLNGVFPRLPKGVFDYTRTIGEDRLTWQPEPGVRSAVVVARVSGTHPGFVMAGRSLRETEFREDQLSFEVGAGILVTLFGTFIFKIIASLA